MLVGRSGRARRRCCGRSPATRPSSGGRVSIGGEDVTRQPPARARHRHGLPELFPLPAHDCPRELGSSPCRPPSCRRPSGRRGSRAVAATLQMQRLLHRYPKELSGGQQQRVAMGRALVRQPQTLPARRAARRARRQAAGRCPLRLQDLATGVGHHHDLRHPRPGRGPGAGREDRRPRRRRGAAGRHARTRSTTRRPTASSPVSSARRR